MRKLSSSTIIAVLLWFELISALPLTQNPPTEGSDGILYKFARTGHPTSLRCEAMSEGSADICKFTR